MTRSASRRRWAARWIVAAALAAATAVTIFLVLDRSGSTTACADKPSYETFREAPIPSPQRERVGQEINRCQALARLSQSEVRGLLGRVSRSNPEGDSWEMGSDGFLDNHYLIVHYDDNNEVEKVWIE